MHRRGFTGRRAQATMLALLFGFLAAVPANAQSNSPDASPKVEIDNFGRVTERFYRGAQPDEADYKALA
ncbi:MAG TPA: hypothetical protein VLD57_01805, partial [Blastocatellia bacterium]|nr:hypothetical protein [Blastocatellia bacterium]